MDENFFEGVWESRGEVLAHHWGKNNLRIDAMKRLRGTFSLLLHHLSLRVTQLSAQKGPIDLQFYHGSM